jgi:hypothetical protein
MARRHVVAHALGLGTLPLGTLDLAALCLAVDLARSGRTPTRG